MLTVLLFSIVPMASSWPSFGLASLFRSPPPPSPESVPALSVPLRKQYVPVSRNGSVVAYKTSYFGEVAVGSPKQHFTVVFDTGSGHLILPSLGCTSETCTKHRRFDREVSSTSRDIEHDGTPIPSTATSRDQVAITFGTGQVVGEFIEDRACISAPVSAAAQDSQHQEPPAQAELCMNLRVVMANQMSPEPFGLFEFDGVLGLGLKALTLNAEFSFFGQMASQHPHMMPQFAVFLARNEEEGNSLITFGGHDPKHAASDVLWAPVALEHLGYWQVQIKNVRIGETIIEECADGECRAILDTGTSLLGVPRLASRTMHRLLARPVPDSVLEASGDSQPVDCRTVTGVELNFELTDGLTVTLGTEDYSRPAPVNVTVENVTRPFCRSLLLPLDMKAPLGPKIFIWGEPVLRKYYTVYDWGEKRVGFARARHESRPSDAKTSGGGGIGTPSRGSLAMGAPLASLQTN